MLTKVLRTIAASAALTGILLYCANPAQAQTAKAAGKAAPATMPDQLQQALALQQANTEGADRTRDQFMDLLRHFSPQVGRVFKLDPSLLSNTDYMATYPAITAFLAQHPEILRNPPYYLEEVRFSSDYDNRPASRSYELFRNIIDWMGGLTVAAIIVSTLVWIIRSLIDYRRWYRLSKVQAEAHTKLVDRLTANEELLAYVQSPAGAKFLESAPITLDAGTRRIGAPFTRILWSVQAGLVAIAAGIGLRYVSSVVTDPDAIQPFLAMGIFAMAVGTGFVISGAASYVLSKHLGLFNRPSGSDNS